MESIGEIEWKDTINAKHSRFVSSFYNRIFIILHKVSLLNEKIVSKKQLNVMNRKKNINQRVTD